jgi:hypothetical protein
VTGSFHTRKENLELKGRPSFSPTICVGCIIDTRDKVKVHRNIKTDPEMFFELIFPYLDDIVVGVECVFCWY